MANQALKLELEKNLMQSSKKEENLLYFINASYIMELVTRELQFDRTNKKTIDKKYIEYLNDFKSSTNQLEKGNKDIRDFQNELSYKAYYQIFEEYMSEVFKTLLNHFPKFLRREKFDLEFDLIFEQENIDLLRKKIIEKRAKKYIQSNNILEIIQKFKSVFGIQISLNKKEKDKLFVASRIRNILTHNSGIVNDIFLDELRIHNISTKLKLGESIYPSLEKELELIEDEMEKIIQKIHKQIFKKIDQIQKYYDSK